MSEDRNRLRKALASGRPVIGFASTLAADGLVESAAEGFDFVWIDGQHGHHSAATARGAVREAQRMGLCAVVRVPGHEYGAVGPFIDSGAEGVIVPMVESAAQAEAIARATRFPPVGARSFGGRRVCDVYGFDYHRTHEPVVIAQIESAAGLRSAGEIAATNGIDMLLLGSVDLAIDLGLDRSEWRVDAPRMAGILRDLAMAADAHGKWLGCVAPGSDALAAALRCGARFVSAGDETAFMRTALAAWLSDANRQREGRTEP
jgi:4-hydroxy-2-oxoheptanedioate aldolase